MSLFYYTAIILPTNFALINQELYICTMQSFRIIPPSPALKPYIRYYWILQDDSVATVSERTLPTGCIQMVFHKGRRLLSLKKQELQPQYFICGQEMGYTDIQSTGDINMIVVVFQPYTAKIFFQTPLRLFREGNVSIEDVEDKELAVLCSKITDTENDETCIRLIEQFLYHRLCGSAEYNVKRLSSVLHQINTLPQVDLMHLADSACLSIKQFSRVFVEYVGASPKEFIRIVRLQRALFIMQQHPQISFAQIAYSCGFSDQSHMIKEFKLFSGYTPTEYLAVCAPFSDYFSNL